MQDTPVVMVRRTMDRLPTHSLPDGFGVRNYRQGDERRWAEIEHAADEFESREAALARFLRDFGDELPEMEDRCFFVVEQQSGRAIGTATAWYDTNFHGEVYGRVHWVAVVPDFQGRKLAKPLMCAVMERLRQSHTRAYLTTHTRCAKAIRMYLDFGFEPHPAYPTCEDAWRYLAGLLDHPALAIYRNQPELPRRHLAR